MALNRIIHALFCVIVVFILVFAATNAPIEHDEAYNATVSKSLVWGYGYSTPYPTRAAFNPYVTTGPALLLPIAAFIAVLGNKYYIPGVASAIVNVGLLWVFGDLILKRQFGSQGIGADILTGLIMAPLCLLVLAFGMAGYSAVALGECAATLCVAIGSYLFADVIIKSELKTRRAFVAGLVLGSSLLFKFIAVLPVVTVVASGAGFLAVRSGVKEIALLRGVVGGAMLPSILLLAVRLPFLDLTKEVIFMARSGSGVSLFKNGVFAALDAIQGVLAANTRLLAHWTGGAAGLALCVVSCGTILQSFRMVLEGKKTDPLESANRLFLLFLLSGGLSILTWWLVLSPWELMRHAYIALVLIIIAMSLAPLLLSKTARWTASISYVLLLSWWSYSWHQRLDGMPPGFSRAFSPNGEISPALTYTGLRLTADPRIADQQAAMHKIKELKGERRGTQFFGCGIWASRDLEYLSEEASLFKDCRIEPKGKPLAFLVINSYYWSPEGPDLRFLAECKTAPLFKAGAFSILECP